MYATAHRTACFREVVKSEHLGTPNRGGGGSASSREHLVCPSDDITKLWWSTIKQNRVRPCSVYTRSSSVDTKRPNNYTIWGRYFICLSFWADGQVEPQRGLNACLRVCARFGGYDCWFSVIHSVGQLYAFSLVGRNGKYLRENKKNREDVDGHRLSGKQSASIVMGAWWG